MFTFPEEKVQHEENDERDRRKPETRHNDRQFPLLFLLL